MGLSLQHLLWSADEGDDMLYKTVTGEKSRVHHYQPESKCASMQCKHPNSPSTKILGVMPLAMKVVLTVFWDSQGIAQSRDSVVGIAICYGLDDRGVGV
jgi:hypothetical protein